MLNLSCIQDVIGCWIKNFGIKYKASVSVGTIIYGENGRFD